jgi:hypothetical protein
MLLDQSRKLMDRTINWKEEIGAIAGPFLPSDTKQSWLARASRRCTVSLRHIQSIYYGQVDDPKFSVASNILSAADQARIEEARRDAAKLAQIYQSTATALGNVDPDFHRGNIDALVSAARILGALDSSGTEREVK